MTTSTADLFEAARDIDADGALRLYKDYQRNLRRFIARARALPDFEEVTIKQRNGGDIQFRGQLLGEETYIRNSTERLEINVKIWRTEAGALVVESTSVPLDRNDGFPSARGFVVEPDEDQQAMRVAVMDFIGWHDHARRLARNLGWSFRSWVD